ncbi:MAG: alpha/beta hydrolase [Pseudomonadota bacterium]|nr:alpha/beta hydrolase [Pseudomonadota bacterium]
MPFAEKYGVVLIAPLFPQDRFPDYQRLGRSNKGARSDLALNRIIDEVGFLTGADSKKLFLFGYSGGAQFVHRYAMTFPQNVSGMVIAAAGWYTFPDYSVNYPYGLKNAGKLFGKPFNPENLLDISTCVLVGDQDIARDSELRKSNFIDQQQGSNRMNRGKAWIQAMKSAAKTYYLNTAFDFRVLPRSNHSFSRCMDRGGMGRTVFKFLFECV